MLTRLTREGVILYFGKCLMIGQDLVTSIFALYNVTSWTTFLSYTIYAFSETIFRILSRFVLDSAVRLLFTHKLIQTISFDLNRECLRKSSRCLSFLERDNPRYNAQRKRNIRSYIINIYTQLILFVPPQEYSTIVSVGLLRTHLKSFKTA